jgi:hypothetical protein
MAWRCWNGSAGVDAAILRSTAGKGNAVNRQLKNALQREEVMTDQAKLDVATINIGNINEGAAIEAFDLELRKILENIGDLSTPACATRAVKLEVIFKPHSDRCQVETEFRCTSKLAAIEKHQSKIFVGRTEEGAVVAFDADPRQMPLWSAPKPKEVKPLEFGK